MVIALFGDSCTGKFTIAVALAQTLSAEIFSGKDYLKHCCQKAASACW